MKKIILLILTLTSFLYSYSTKILNGYAVSIYNEQKIEENIQAKRKTSKDYNGICYSKVYIFGKILNGNVKVMIGKSIGHKVQQRSIQKNRLIVGKEIIFKHYGVKKEGAELVEVKKNHRLLTSFLAV